MPAAKKPGKTVKLADLLRQVQEETPKIVVEADDGQTFEIDPPELWDDAVFDVTGGPVAEARAIMGSDEYDRFRKAGGRAALVSYLIQKHTGGTPLGE